MSLLPDRDILELWRRLLFTVLNTNTDDQHKNHGLLYVLDNRWRLSAMLDVNPHPRRQPTLETGISDIHGFEPSVETVVEAAPFYDIEEADAKTMAG